MDSTQFPLWIEGNQLLALIGIILLSIIGFCSGPNLSRVSIQ